MTKLSTYTDQDELIYGMSVVICCYNSQNRLPPTLEHLLNQQVPGEYLWEVLIVDNASKDQTAKLVKEFQSKFSNKGMSLRIVREDRPGQFFARMTGTKNAKYEYITFCDDDNWLSKNYVHDAIRMIERSIHFGAGGGRNYPVTDAHEYPDWFEEYKDKYALGIPADSSKEISLRGFVLGAGMVTKKSLYIEMFNEEFPSLLKGRNGNSLSTGDDFEYAKRLLLAGYKLYYDQSLELKHFIPHQRLTLDYRARLMEGINQAGLILDLYNEAISVKNKVKDKNRFRICFLAPIRILMSKIGVSKREANLEKLVFLYLSPFKPKDNNVAVIKQFFLKYRDNKKHTI